MPSHAERTAGFHAALFAGPAPAGLIAPAGDPVRRFAVYRNNVHHGLSRALAQRVPVVARLVGADFFAALARAFLHRHQPRTPVLHEWGAELPGFLESFEPVAQLPYLADVARLELARGRAYHAADAMALTPDAAAAALAAAVYPGALRLVLHPSVHWLASPWPVLRIWQANRPGAPAGRVTGGGAEAALIARDTGLAVIVLPLAPASAEVLTALAAGRTLEAAAEAADPAETLGLLLRHRLILDIRTGDAP